MSCPPGNVGRSASSPFFVLRFHTAPGQTEFSPLFFFFSFMLSTNLYLHSLTLFPSVFPTRMVVFIVLFLLILPKCFNCLILIFFIISLSVLVYLVLLNKFNPTNNWSHENLKHHLHFILTNAYCFDVCM